MIPGITLVTVVGGTSEFCITSSVAYPILKQQDKTNINKIILIFCLMLYPLSLISLL